MKIGVGLIFPGALQDESIICALCKDFDITMNIIEASFSITSGWAFLRIEGDKKEIERAFDYLKKKNIKIEKIQTRQDSV